MIKRPESLRWNLPESVFWEHKDFLPFTKADLGVYAASYDNYDHFTFGNSVLPSGPYNFGAQLNPVHLIHLTDQWCLQS